MAREERTARLTVLIDPHKKAVFEQICRDDDTTPSQVVRRLIRRYIEESTGHPWTPEETPEQAREAPARPTRRQDKRR